MSLLPFCCPHEASALYPQGGGEPCPFLSFWPIPAYVVVLAHFSPLPCATSGTFVQNAVIQSRLKISGKTPTDLYDLWCSPCLHPALKSACSTRCMSSNLQHYRKALCYSDLLYGARSLSLFYLTAFREMTWHCLSVPCSATGREIRGGSIAYRRMSHL